MPSVLESPEEFRESLRGWLADHAADLDPFRGDHAGTFEEETATEAELRRLLFEADWTRWGWPVDCDGLGGGPLLRGVLYDELTAAGIAYPHFSECLEIAGTVLLRYAPDLARAYLPAAMDGSQFWCLAFSEPDAGSDMASIATRAVDEGDSFRINGQKVWQTGGHVSDYMMMLGRTGTPESRHRGLTMFWVDLKAPGVTVRPIVASNGRHEVAEVFLDDVVVPRSHLVGDVGDGWGVVMFLMQFERGVYAWQRQTRLHLRLDQAVARSTRPPAEVANVIGDTYLQLFALRMKARTTIMRLASGEAMGPEASVDKTMLSQAEQAVYDAARQLLWPELEIGDSDAAQIWRDEWWYSRAATIFGGAIDVQRDIISELLLGLPRRRSGGS